jgi:uncharacterized C2H2 Zn-finger protein
LETTVNGDLCWTNNGKEKPKVSDSSRMFACHSCDKVYNRRHDLRRYIHHSYKFKTPKKSWKYPTGL